MKNHRSDIDALQTIMEKNRIGPEFYDSEGNFPQRSRQPGDSLGSINLSDKGDSFKGFEQGEASDMGSPTIESALKIVEGLMDQYGDNEVVFNYLQAAADELATAADVANRDW